jgi:hypothetical protein
MVLDTMKSNSIQANANEKALVCKLNAKVKE